MEVNLTHSEKQAIKEITENHKKTSYKMPYFPIGVLIASAILILFPLGFLIKNFNNIDVVINSVGIYLLALIMCGIGCTFFYAYLNRQLKMHARDSILSSAVSKLIEACQIAL